MVTMLREPVVRRADAIAKSLAGLLEFESRSSYARLKEAPGTIDLTYGNPHEAPLPELVDALQRWSRPLSRDWFAYKMSEPAARAAAAEGLRERLGLSFAAEDVALTPGGFAALGLALKAVVEPGDEVIYSLPSWFFYESLTIEAGGEPVTVGLEPDTLDLDLDAIAAAITPRTRVVIVNSPHNPTGRLYSSETLRALADLLYTASARYGRTIYIISDEPYARIAFDGARAASPAECYAHTLVCYSYGKVWLTPGQRIGYLALPPSMPDNERKQLRRDIVTLQLNGWIFPNAVMQHALPEIEQASIDVAHIQRKRDRMVAALRRQGYEVRAPEGTFYLYPKSPMENDQQFAEILAGHGVFVLPGSICGQPGFFRICLTATDDMLARSLPAFARAFEEAPVYELVAAAINDGA